MERKQLYTLDIMICMCFDNLVSCCVNMLQVGLDKALSCSVYSLLCFMLIIIVELITVFV